jgi:aspartate 1-decarboxylase
MLLNLLKAKIHRAVVTDANVAYEGSITIDRGLLEASGIHVHEQVHVVDVDNGQRFVTYVIEGAPGSGVMCVNGAAARLVSPGDRIIVIAYCHATAEEARTHRPRVVFVDEKNAIREAHELDPAFGDSQASGLSNGNSRQQLVTETGSEKASVQPVIHPGARSDGPNWAIPAASAQTAPR